MGVKARASNAKDAGIAYDGTQQVPTGFRNTELGVLPTEWAVRSLGELGQSLIGLTYDPQDIDPSGVLVLRSSNIGNNSLQFGGDVYVKTDIPDRIVARRNDLLICVRNGSRPLIGKCALIDEGAVGMTFGAFMSVFRSDDNRFVFHCFQSDIIKRQINEHLGATINQITNKSLNSFQIPYPERREREAITAALSDMDELLGALDTLIAKKQDIKLGAMQRLLTGETRLPGFSEPWTATTMGKIGSIYGGLSGKSKNDFGNGAARYVTFLGIMANTLIRSNHTEHVRVEPGETQNRVLKGDLLFNGTSETPNELALGAVVDEEVDDLYLNSFCFGFRIHDAESYYPLYVAYFFRKSAGRSLMRGLAQGATRYNLSKTHFLSLELSMPSFPEQREIAHMLGDLDAEILALEQRRAKTLAIKQGMMQKLLIGRTRLI